MLKARVEKAKGNTAEAIALFGKVVDANPFRAEAYRERGELRIATGDESNGNDDLKHAAELTSNTDGNADGEDIAKKVNDAYKNINPMGL